MRAHVEKRDSAEPWRYESMKRAAYVGLVGNLAVVLAVGCAGRWADAEARDVRACFPESVNSPSGSENAKPTAYDDVEKAVGKIVSPYQVDARYLAAIKAILAYVTKGSPVGVTVTFGDFQLPEAKFSWAANGCALRWGDVGQWCMPGGRRDPTETQEYYLYELNNGGILMGLQKMVSMDRERFAQHGQKIVRGPEKREDGGIFYEFDWSSGGRNPRVVIYPQPHGALRVVLVKWGGEVSLDGGNTYEFAAGGFQDMMRTFKRLQDWVDGGEAGRKDASRLQEERFARFFERSNCGSTLQSEIPAEAGRLLRVISARWMEPDGKRNQGEFDRGYFLEFDWMFKLIPPVRLQVIHDKGRIAAYLMPRGEKLMEAGGELDVVMREVWGKVAEQRVWEEDRYVEETRVAAERRAAHEAMSDEKARCRDLDFRSDSRLIDNLGFLLENRWSGGFENHDVPFAPCENIVGLSDQEKAECRDYCVKMAVEGIPKKCNTPNRNAVTNLQRIEFILKWCETFPLASDTQRSECRAECLATLATDLLGRDGLPKAWVYYQCQKDELGSGYNNDPGKWMTVCRMLSDQSLVTKCEDICWKGIIDEQNRLSEARREKASRVWNRSACLVNCKSSCSRRVPGDLFREIVDMSCYTPCADQCPAQ